MGPAELLTANLLSPMVLAFGLGAIATAVRSDLRLPEALVGGLTVYLLLAIGLKGGAALSGSSVAEVWRPALATLALGLVTPLLAYAVAKGLGRMSVADAAALAAHYGSVSAVTFIASVTLIQDLGLKTEGFLPALVAILEVPAIVLALLLARRETGGMSPWRSVGELARSKTILLLVGGMAIGLLSGQRGLKQVAPLFVEPFHGVLALFLLDMGMVAARRLGDLRRSGLFVLGYGLLVPPVNGVLGVLAGAASGMSIGGTAVLGAMAASASYIAAPAVVRTALPQASPGIYLTAALGVTFPFNLALGIPLYVELAQLWVG